MDLARDVKSISYLKSHAAELVAAVCDGGRAVTITQNGQARVVVMDARRFERMQRALLMTQLVEVGRAEAAAGRSSAQVDVFARLEQQIADAAADVDG